MPKHFELAVLVGLFFHFCRILRGFSPLYAISTDLNIAPAAAFFLDAIEHLFRDYWIIVAFSSVSVNLTSLVLRLALYSGVWVLNITAVP